MNLSRIRRLALQSGRFGEITGVLAKYGLAGWIGESPPDWIRNLFKSKEGERLGDLSFEVRVRKALAELGTTFIKMGQMLSTRADLVGEELADELAKLQQGTPPDPPEVARKTVETELGRTVEEAFAEFEEEATASASIGQVHRATLHGGRLVVVKVQKAGIEDKVRGDLTIIAALADLAESMSAEAALYRPRLIVDEFRRTLLAELDFRREMRNLEEFRRNFADDATVHIPEPVPELCTQRVLTMERLTGFSVADEEKVTAAGVDTSEFARRGANLYLDMVFRDGFYHADPHPGNLWVLPGDVLGLLDCGMAGRLDDRTREEFEDILLAAIDRDAERIVDYMVRSGSVPVEVDRRMLTTAVGELTAEYGSQSLTDFDLSGAINAVMDLVRQYHISLPPGVSQLLKVLVMLEGTARHLAPDFNLAELIQPYYMQIAMRRFSPRRLAEKLKNAWRDWDHLLTMLPRSLAEALDRLRAGTFQVKLEHKGLETTINRMTYGIVAAALVMASSLLLSQRVGPQIGDVSVLGAVAGLSGVYLAIRLLRAIHRSGDLG